MSKIFLSHSSAQKYLVEGIANRLGRDRVIYDNYSFEAGMDSLAEIIKGLNETDLLVIFISEEALNSPWVQAELSISSNLINLNAIKQLLPIVIDESISHTDPRIPTWIKHRNLKVLKDRFLIVKKIEQQYRDVLIQKNPLIIAKEEIFVGRNDKMEEFESSILTTSSIRPVSYICSGIEGVGRRTFMKKALAKTRHIDKTYEPISIHLDAKESIEDFIIKIEDLNGDLSDIVLNTLQNSSFEEKVGQATRLVEKLITNNEKLFILDSGCIIQPTKRIADWFLAIIKHENIKNTLCIILITRFRPNPSFIVKTNYVSSIHIDALSQKDLAKLFVQYSDVLELSVNEESSNKILASLNGLPSQVFFALDMARASSVNYVISHISEIVQYGDAKVFYIMDEIQKDKTKLDILVLIAKVDFISYDLLYKIIDRNEKNEQILEDFFLMGVYDTFGGFSDHIKINYSIGDYIKRSKFEISQSYKSKLKSNMKAFFSDDNKDWDVSELLINVKAALTQRVKIPDRYFLPSYVLKSLVDMYYQRHYDDVIKLADKILDNRINMDQNMAREIRYWLCLALARLKMSRFEFEVVHIDGADYEFLYGFYYRRLRQFDNALKFFRRALDKSPNFNRAKRELVNVLLSKGLYGDALEAAKQNYENGKTNAFHIQAYFICLIRQINLNRADSSTLKHLLEVVKKTNEKKADEIYDTMLGEYEYYVNRDVPKAISVLSDSLKRSEYKYYPYKALFEIYIKQGQYPAAEELKAKYDRDFFALEEI